MDRLFRNLALWQTETFELFNDFCLLLYAFAPGITADFLDSGEAIRAEGRKKAFGRILDRCPQPGQLDYEFGKGIHRLGDDEWEFLIECFRNFSRDRKTTDYDGKIFDHVLQSMYRAEKLAAFITPPSLADLMAELVEPEPGELVIDPVCGSGGLLTSAAAKCGECRFIGNDMDGRLRIAAYFNARFHRLRNAEFYRKDFLTALWEEPGDVILANPPYDNEPGTTIAFLERILDILKAGGRCAALVPEGFLTNTAKNRVISMRRTLLYACSVEAVISLPREIYRPYTNSKSSLILFKKEPASSGHLTFFGSVPEYDGLENEFSNEAYRKDMEKIAQAWKLWRRGEHPAGENELFWTAASEELQKLPFILDADCHRGSGRTYVSQKKNEVWDSIFAGQKNLERFVRNYFGEDAVL